jgi:hypothetical protein
MRGKIPRVCQVSLETLTPLRIGAGGGAGKPLVDEALGGRRIPPEYDPKPERDLQKSVIKLKDGTAYIPGSTLRGWLRGLYTGALEAAGSPDPERRADEVMGSTEHAGKIALNDLFADTMPGTISDQLVRFGAPSGKSRRSFPAELVKTGTIFTGTILYIDDALPQVLQTIFAQDTALENWLRTGSNGGVNPETTIPGSPINGTLFQRNGAQWIVKWKLGQYAKSYAKALTHRRAIGSPHAYYLVEQTNEVPGWVQVVFDCPSNDFQLNAWGKEQA